MPIPSRGRAIGSSAEALGRAPKSGWTHPRIYETLKRRKRFEPSHSRMSNIVRLAEIRRNQRIVFFNRRELNHLLSLYSRRVARGQWRDYALDHRPGLAVFSVFRSSREKPLFTITKRHLPGDKAPEYALMDGRHPVRRSPEIADLVEAFDRELRVVG